MGAVAHKKSHTAERIAFDPFLPKDEIINEYIRNTITPDIDIGQSYYLGTIVHVVEKDDRDVDGRDIFYSMSDNHERVTKSIADKKYNSNRKTLFVHIPSFMTSQTFDPAKILNFNSFTKIRVDYLGDKSPKPGDLVKLQFRDKNSYSNPFIIDIESVEGASIDSRVASAKALFEQYTSCGSPRIGPLEGLSQEDLAISTYGGYYQALREIGNIFSPEYISMFFSTEKEKEKESLISIISLGLAEKAYKEVQDVPDSIRNLVKGRADKNVEITGIVDISTIIAKKFFTFVQQNLTSKTNWFFHFNLEEKSFGLDINLDVKGTEEEKLDGYIKISTELKNSTTRYSAIKPEKQKSTTSSSIKQSSEITSCEDKIIKDKSIYPAVYEGVVKSEYDVNVIKGFHDNSVNPASFLTKNYFEKLYDGPLKVKKPFYVDDKPTNDNYNSKEINVFNIKELDSNFKIIIRFLNDLRSKISSTERVPIEDVLILPKQVLKLKKGTAKGDTNSRHYYGKAVDFRVYIKDKDNKVFQIPPDIVALYADQVGENFKFIGQGVFLSPKTFYNHVEFLGDWSGLGEEREQHILYFGRTNGEKLSKSEEQIEAQVTGADKLRVLKKIVATNGKYINPTTKRLDSRIEGLI